MKKLVKTLPALAAGSIVIAALTLPGSITGAAVSNLPAKETGFAYLSLGLLALTAFTKGLSNGRKGARR